MAGISGSAGVGLLVGVFLAVMTTGSDTWAGSAFDEFVGLRGTSHSRDGFRMVVVLEAWWYRLKLPGHARVVIGPNGADVGRENPYVGVVVGCRLDGRGYGFLEGAVPFSVMLVGLHPDEGDVPVIFDLKYWWLGLTGREYEKTPVEVRLGGAPPMEAMLVRQRIDYSIPRPDQEIDLDALSVVRTVGDGGGIVAQVTGVDVKLEAVFIRLEGRQLEAVKALERECPWGVE